MNITKKLNNTATIPPTNHDTIVFGFDFVFSKFNKNHYKPHMTNNLVPEDELAHFLRELETQIQNQIKACGRDTMLRCFCVVFLFVAVLALIISLHSVGVIKDNPYNIVLIVLLSFIGSSFLIFCFLFAKFFVKSKNLAMDINHQAKTYVDEKGKTFLTKGLTWVIPSHYPSWIELWTDKLPHFDPNKRITNKQSIIKEETEKMKQIGFFQPLSTDKQLGTESRKQMHFNINIPESYKLKQENASNEVPEQNKDRTFFDNPAISPSTTNSSMRFLSSRIQKSFDVSI